MIDGLYSRPCCGFANGQHQVEDGRAECNAVMDRAIEFFGQIENRKKAGLQIVTDGREIDGQMEHLLAQPSCLSFCETRQRFTAHAEQEGKRVQPFGIFNDRVVGVWWNDENVVYLKAVSCLVNYVFAGAADIKKHLKAPVMAMEHRTMMSDKTIDTDARDAWQTERGEIVVPFDNGFLDCFSLHA